MVLFLNGGTDEARVFEFASRKPVIHFTTVVVHYGFRLLRVRSLRSTPPYANSATREKASLATVILPLKKSP